MRKNYYFGIILLVVFCDITSSTVIIIGTGPAGIAAATKLLKNNVTDILILEAESRIGGRINSVEFGDAIVDLGAEWCHGQGDNIVYNLVKEHDILRHTEMSHLVSYSNGDRIDENFSKEIFSVIENIYVPDGDREQNEGYTLGEYCTNKYWSAINQLTINSTNYLKFVNDFLSYFHHYVISSEGAFTWFEPSAVSDFRDCSGDLAQNWNGRGFKTILNILMQKFPNTSEPLPIDDKIIFNKEVETILWDNKDNDVIVKCSDGSWYQGDQIIFTASLGVLKEKHRNMFEPQLPQKKQLAIEKLGIGAVMKVMLLFQKRWWPTTFTGISFVWTAEHKNSNFEKFTKLGKTWIFDAFILVTVANNPNVLSLWITGESVPIVEQLDSVELLEGVNFILKTYLESIYNLTYPISFVRSQWYTNPHFRGTYSYQTVASRQTAGNQDLGAPLFNRNGKLTLMFAGEATHPYYYSTVHGAIETGHREAERVLQVLNGH